MVEFVLNFMVNDHIAHKVPISRDRVHVQAKRALNSWEKKSVGWVHSTYISYGMEIYDLHKKYSIVLWRTERIPKAKTKRVGPQQ